MTATTTPIIEKVYLENEYVREGRNGRLYIGVLGWRFICLHPDADPIGHKTLNAARQEAFKLVSR